MKNPLEKLSNDFNLDLIEMICVNVWPDRDNSTKNYEIEKFSFFRKYIRAKDIKSFYPTTREITSQKIEFFWDANSRQEKRKYLEKKTVETLNLLSFTIDGLDKDLIGILPCYVDSFYKKTLDKITAIEISEKLRGKKS